MRQAIQRRRGARRRSIAAAVPHAVSTAAPHPLHDAVRRRTETLLHVVAACVERYLPLWLEKSRAMRLSSVEALDDKAIWKDVTRFVKKYGGELFHANRLSLGDLRAILHLGPRQFIEQLDENRDPIEPFPLLDDLDSGDIDSWRVERILEVVYSALADKFDRFVEYNTTTTQSDYGEEITSLLDFLRVETAYERDAWNLVPFQLAHEVLAECGNSEASAVWEHAFRHRSSAQAEKHLEKLRGLEFKYGMRMASIRDHLSECFVKPLAVDRMRALIPRAIEEVKRGRATSPAFRELQREVDKYLQDTTGSGIDVPEWLRTLEEQVMRVIGQVDVTAEPTDVPIEVSPILLGIRQISRQFED